jgi:tRNA pseudouridine55 synthase
MGFLNVDKPAGWTSHDVVAKVRSWLRGAGGPKVGHVGTLDPMATGVLPLCIGKATKVASYLAAEEKSYRAVMKLGERTDTQDATGTVLTSVQVGPVDRGQLEAVCAEFVGTIRQLPPMYSAVKVGGTPLYKAARAGRVVERSPREVHIASLLILEIDGPLVTLDVDCSKGTYIRTLCADIGDRLGVGAHLHQLQRRRVGPFTLEQAITLDQVEAAVASGTITGLLVPVDHALAHLPLVTVDAAAAERVRHGAPLPARAVTAAAPLAVGQEVCIRLAGGDVIAVGQVVPAGPTNDASAWMIRAGVVLAAQEDARNERRTDTRTGTQGGGNGDSEETA